MAQTILEQPSVILSAFGDEAAPQKTADQQFSALAALGLQYYSLRFIDAGGGVKNVMQLTRQEIAKIRHWEAEYGLCVASIGSPIGKVKLCDKEDGTKNRFVPFKKYLTEDVARACEMAHAFETKLIRGFSFYHPRGEDPKLHLEQAAEQIGKIAEACHRSDLTFGLEVEANLVGQNGLLMAELYRRIDHPAVVLIWDGGNISSQGFSAAETFEHYLAMKSGLGWMHVKDYLPPRPISRQKHVDEEALKHFVPADEGASCYDLVLKDFREELPKLTRRLKRRGIPGVFLDLEPHLKGGGQFGGYSGPDGMGVALRGLVRLLDLLKIDYHLRDFADIQAARGF